jgi:hypothetical protein
VKEPEVYKDGKKLGCCQIPAWLDVYVIRCMFGVGTRAVTLGLGTL